MPGPPIQATDWGNVTFWLTVNGPHRTLKIPETRGQRGARKAHTRAHVHAHTCVLADPQAYSHVHTKQPRERVTCHPLYRRVEQAQRWDRHTWIHKLSHPDPRTHSQHAHTCQGHVAWGCTQTYTNTPDTGTHKQAPEVTDTHTRRCRWVHMAPDRAHRHTGEPRQQTHGHGHHRRGSQDAPRDPALQTQTPTHTASLETGTPSPQGPHVATTSRRTRARPRQRVGPHVRPMPAGHHACH